MAAAGEVLRRNLPGNVDHGSLKGSPELHVLAVDDSLVDRKVIEKLLRSLSCKVTAVESGSRALQFLGLDGEKKISVGFDALKVNLIMTDYSMPGMTGYELLKKIKGSSDFREIPVVIMSSEKMLGSTGAWRKELRSSCRSRLSSRMSSALQDSSREEMQRRMFPNPGRESVHPTIPSCPQSHHLHPTVCRHPQNHLLLCRRD